MAWKSFRLCAGICFAAVAAVSSPAQVPSATASPAVVANVYVQTLKGVNVYSVSATGKPTLIKGSPFAESGQMEGISGKYLLSVGTTNLHAYAIASNGAIGQAVSNVDTRSYNGSACGTTSTSVDGVVPNGANLDHSGQYFYVQLNGNRTCAAWQTYKVGSNGALQFIGDDQYFEQDINGLALSSSVPTISSNNRFGYGVFMKVVGNPECEYHFVACSQFSAFVRAPNGTLTENTGFSVVEPQTAWLGWAYYPYNFASAQADPNGNLAVLMNQTDGDGVGDFLQVASFSIDPTTGAIASKNTNANMPYVGVGDPAIMHMAPSGKLVAIGGHPGLRIFHFNGAQPVTAFSSMLLPTVNIDQVEWDKSNHLYALSYSSQKLYVYTVTPTTIAAVAGSPFAVQNAYGIKGLIVVPR